MAGVITTGLNPTALWPGLQAHWGEKYGQHPLECAQIFNTEMSDKAYEETVENIGFGLAPVKEQGTSVQYDTQQQGIVNRFTNSVYSLGFIVTEEEIEDNLYMDRAFKRTEMLAFSMRTTKENVGANILNRGFNASYVGGDGVSLINSGHVTADGTQSNVLATAADLSEASLEDILIQINNAKNSRGLQVSIRGNKLIIPTAYEFTAARITKSILQNDTADNAVNALRATGSLPDGYTINHYLSDTDAWFVKTNCPNGLTHFERRGMQFAEDNDFDTSNMKFKASERYVFGWSDWRGVYGTPGA